MRKIYTIFVICMVLLLSSGFSAYGSDWEAHIERADSLASERRFDLARDAAVAALRQVDEIYGAEDTLTLHISNMVGIYIMDNHDYLTAESLYINCLEIARGRYGENHISTAKSYYGLGQVQRNLGFKERALEYYNRSLDICIRLYGDEHEAVG